MNLARLNVTLVLPGQT